MKLLLALCWVGAVGCIDYDELPEATCPAKYVVQSVDQETGTYVCIERWGTRRVEGILRCPPDTHMAVPFQGAHSVKCVPDAPS